MVGSLGGSSSGHAEPEQAPVSPEVCSDRRDSEHVTDQALKPPGSFCRAGEQAIGSSSGVKEEKHLLGGCCSFSCVSTPSAAQKQRCPNCSLCLPTQELALVIYHICLSPIFRTRLP